MTLRFIDYRTAIAKKNPYADWEKAQDRLRPEAWPQVQPSFSLDPGETILTIGSCFARNIELQLAQNGFRVPSLSLGLFGEASLLNKFTPPSISQEISWAARIYRRDDKMSETDVSQYMYVLRNGSVIDNNLADFLPVSAELFLARRERIYQIFREAFTAKCVVLTPGLAEAWFDSERKLFIQRILTGHHADISRNLKFTMLDFETCFGCLDQTVSIIRELNPQAKFLITTSPVPLEHTFSGQDVLIANTYAKSVLRAACGDLTAKWDGVDYFPSYESVMLTRSYDVFASDNLHVDSNFVVKIIKSVLKFYCPALHQAAPRNEPQSETASQQELTSMEARLKAAMAASDFDEAASLLERLVALAPHVTTHWFMRAQAHEMKGDFDAAMRYFDEAVDRYVASGDRTLPQYLEPDIKLDYRLNLSRRSGNLEMEIAMMKEIAQLRPDNPQLQFQIANALWNTGKLAEAESYFIRAWELKGLDR